MGDERHGGQENSRVTVSINAHPILPLWNLLFCESFPLVVLLPVSELL